MYKYTKLSDELVDKYGLKMAWVYAKLSYRMKLSLNNPKYYLDNNGYFIIYKVVDLVNDCPFARNTVINILKKLDDLHLIYKVRTAYVNKIYLPKFTNSKTKSRKQMSRSPRRKPSKEQISKNKYNNNYVYSSNCSSVKKAKTNYNKKFPKLSQIIKRFGKRLVGYSFKIYHRELDKNNHIHNTLHFIYGILRRWQRKGINTVNDAMKSEHDSHYINPKIDEGPEIPIFKI